MSAEAQLCSAQLHPDIQRGLTDLVHDDILAVRQDVVVHAFAGTPLVDQRENIHQQIARHTEVDISLDVLERHLQHHDNHRFIQTDILEQAR